MDCRRQARKRGLVIRGPQKIWDSWLAAAGMLFAKQAGDAVFRRYHDSVFERFWKRELDIEDTAIIGSVLTEAGADAAAFARQTRALRDEVTAISRAAEEGGVFQTSAICSQHDATGGMSCVQRSFATATSSWTQSPTRGQPPARCW
jgi:2-hydroxychromene-2-carboxylate isomerase